MVAASVVWSAGLSSTSQKSCTRTDSTDFEIPGPLTLRGQFAPYKCQKWSLLGSADRDHPEFQNRADPTVAEEARRPDEAKITLPFFFCYFRSFLTRFSFALWQVYVFFMQANRKESTESVMNANEIAEKNVPMRRLDFFEPLWWQEGFLSSL